MTSEEGLEQMEPWDNGLANIWQVSLERWLTAAVDCRAAAIHVTIHVTIVTTVSRCHPFENVVLGLMSRPS